VTRAGADVSKIDNVVIGSSAVQEYAVRISKQLSGLLIGD
jgi:hypothetical protein